MKKFYMIVAVLLAMIFAFAPLTGCKKKPDDPYKPPTEDEQEDPKAKRPTVEGEIYGEGRTLNLYMWGPTPVGLDAAVAEYKRRTADKFGFDIKFKFDDIDNYKQNLTLKIGSGSEDLDLVFDAQWIYLQKWANEGNYVKLDKYFENPEYPGLNSAFSKEYLNNNKFNRGVYGVPITQTYGDSTAVFYRNDWRKQAVAAGKTELADGINSIAEFEVYLQWVRDNKPGVTPFISNKDANNSQYSVVMAEPESVYTVAQFKNAGIAQSVQLSPGISADVYINPETKVVEEAYVRDFEKTSVLADFPAPFNSQSVYMGNWQAGYTKVREWNQTGLTHPDPTNITNSESRFKTGLAGSMVWTLGQFTQMNSSLKANDPSAELEVFIYDKYIRNKTKGYFGTDWKAWNFLSIPKTSVNEDLAMLFLDWVFESRENNDLFTYGVDGVHWNKVDPGEGGGSYQFDVAGCQPYTMPGYQLSWNPNYIRLPYGATDKVLEYTKYVYDISSYEAKLYPDFTFDYTPVETKLNNPSFGTYLTQHRGYWLGAISDPVNQWNSLMNERYNNTAFQKDILSVKAELIMQFQDFIDKKK